MGGATGPGGAGGGVSGFGQQTDVACTAESCLVALAHGSALVGARVGPTGTVLDSSSVALTGTVLEPPLSAGFVATDGSDFVFENCNDCVMMTPVASERPRPIKRFLVGPVGAEICGPLMAPDERAFFCSIQHPGANNIAGVDFSTLRWSGEAPTSHFPEGGEAWPRSAVVVITRDDGGRIGD